MILIITISAAAGAILRYLLSSLNRDFPWGTLLANNLAVFSIPFFLQFSSEFSTAMIIGFAGSLSTVSSYALEITKLPRIFKVRYSILTLVSCVTSFELANFVF
jgi:fluoride ion exporter CrcB/FEX